MRRVIYGLATLLFLLPDHAHGVISLTQHKSVQVLNAPTPQTLAYDSNITPGGLLVACIALGGAVLPTGVTDSLGQTWVKAADGAAAGDGNATVSIWYYENSLGGANTISVAFQNGLNFRMSISEYAGVATSGSLDQINNASGTGTAVDAGNVTTTQADEVLVVAARNNTAVTFTAGTNYVVEEQAPAAPGARLAYEDRIVSAIGTYSGDITSSGSIAWAACIATFKALASGASALKQTIMRGGTINGGIIR